jgi:hypothetical protein
MPVKIGKGRQQTVSVGPIGALVMLCFWYPVVIAVALCAWLIWGAWVLTAAGVRHLQQRHGGQQRSEQQRRQQRQQERAAGQQEYHSPEAVAWRAAEKADHDARTYRAVVSALAIDPLAGGHFTITAPDRPALHLAVPPGATMEFLSLRRRDVIQVTVTADGGGIEEFWHMARANGAAPRNPADFGKGDTARFAAKGNWLQIIEPEDAQQPAPWPAPPNGR